MEQLPDASDTTSVRHGGLLERSSAAASEWAGRNAAFGCAVALIVGWALSGPIFHYSDGWALFINSTTSVVTFLMVFLIQRAQNKHTMALQVKVNELLAAHKHAKNSLIAVEGLSEDELRKLHAGFVRIGAMARDNDLLPQRLDVEAPAPPRQTP